MRASLGNNPRFLKNPITVQGWMDFLFFMSEHFYLRVAASFLALEPKHKCAWGIILACCLCNYIQGLIRTSGELNGALIGVLCVLLGCMAGWGVIYGFFFHAGLFSAEHWEENERFIFNLCLQLLWHLLYIAETPVFLFKFIHLVKQ